MTPADIRALRERMHQTQEQFARTMEVSVRAVSQWENGKNVPLRPFRDRLARLAKKYPVKETAQ